MLRITWYMARTFVRPRPVVLCHGDELLCRYLTAFARISLLAFANESSLLFVTVGFFDVSRLLVVRFFIISLLIISLLIIRRILIVSVRTHAHTFALITTAFPIIAHFIEGPFRKRQTSYLKTFRQFCACCVTWPMCWMLRRTNNSRR